MKKFYSEFQSYYETYTFSYAVYAVMENEEELSDLYNMGFLPFTGITDIKENIFYMCRSLRINLDRFNDTSENRRIDNKFKGMDICIENINKNTFDLKDNTFNEFVIQYANERFKKNVLDKTRLKYIMRREFLNKIIKFRFKGEILAYVLIVENDEMMHFWYSFLNTKFLKSHNIGKWIMWKCIHLAKNTRKKYIYLGTCYTNNSLYKVRNHKGIEYFDGNSWQNNISILKKLCKSDSSLGLKREDHYKSQYYCTY